jgi:protein TonB
MRNDLYFGALVALGAHAALALISPAVRQVRPPAVDDTLITCVFPKQEELVEPEPEAGDPVESKPTTVSAPRLPEVPRMAPTGVFTMPPTVVPEGTMPDSKTTTIPTERLGSKKGAVEIVDLTLLDRTPIARFQAQPQYPFEMRHAGISGEVLVEFIVEANGSVRDARVVRSSQREFEAAAVQAVSKWTFRPGQKGGRNVATRMQVPIAFGLNEGRE